MYRRIHANGGFMRTLTHSRFTPPVSGSRTSPTARLAAAYGELHLRPYDQEPVTRYMKDVQTAANRLYNAARAGLWAVLIFGIALLLAGLVLALRTEVVWYMLLCFVGIGVAMGADYHLRFPFVGRASWQHNYRWDTISLEGFLDRQMQPSLPIHVASVVVALRKRVPEARFRVRFLEDIDPILELVVDDTDAVVQHVLFIWGPYAPKPIPFIS